MSNFVNDFCSTASKRAEDIAIVDRNGERSTTYGELLEKSLKVVSKIQSLGIKKGSAILLCMDRCVEYVEAYIGIMASGCAVVPLTPEYPKDRVDYIRENSESPLTITEGFMDDIDGFAAGNVVDVDDSDPAYIIYTSGSTGKPKGVVHTVKSYYQVCHSVIELYDIGEKPVYGAVTTFSFMAFVFDVPTQLTLGSEIHLLSESQRKDANLIADYYLKHKINIGFISPQLLKNFHNKSPYLKRIITGSELVSNIYSGSYEIVNIYGATETGLVSRFLIDKPYFSTPIGKPFDGCELVIIPEDGSSNASEGELCVIGNFAKEYYNLPEKTKETFEIQKDGRVLYHTGDIVRLGDDGNYIYLNRRDWMVKINGQRVETLEIENVLNGFEEVKNTAVKAFVDEDGQNYICAYYIPEENGSEAHVREYLKKKLPPYMIPRFLVKMEKLPLTASGKLDRTALTPPSVNDYKEDYIAPSGEKETVICDAFEEILHCGKAGTHDDFFSLGGDSIKVLRLIDTVEKKLGLTISTSDVITGRTPEKIALLLKQKDEDTITHSSVIPESVRLTESQRGVYLECREKPESTMYNIPFALTLPNGIDKDKFEKAVIAVAEHHPSLFVRIAMKDGDFFMVSGKNAPKVKKSKADCLESAKENFVRPFDLENGPLYRFEICETADGTVFLMDVHHIVFDGTSVKVVLNQIADAYAGGTVPDEELTIFDVAESEKTLTETRKYKDAQQFFKSMFDGVEFENDIAPDVAVKTAKKEGSMVTVRDGSMNVSVIENLARKSGVTESTLFMSAFAYTLSMYLGTGSSSFTTVNNGRHDERLMNAAGMFVKTFPIHIDIPESGNITEYIHSVNDIFYKTMEHDCISFGELVGSYGINTNISFVYQSDLLSEVKIGDSVIFPEELPCNDCQDDIICMVLKTGAGYEVRMHFRTALFTEAFMRQIAETVFTVLKGFNECENLCDIQLISEKSREFIDGINRTEQDYDTESTVSSLIEEVVAKYPGKTALVYKDRKYTFGEFDDISKKVASYITKKGIGIDDFVAVLGNRTDETVLAAWGVIRAGAGFQPLDPTYPPERLNYMVSDSKAKLLIADRSLCHLTDSYKGDILYFDEIPELPCAPHYHKDAKPEGAFALIYTSGTTGNPKGCVLENRNIVAFFHNHKKTMEMDETTRMASYASFGFDAGVMDIVTIPLNGGTLYIVPDDIRLDLEKVEEFYCENKITHGFMTTQVGRMFAEETKCSTLRAFLAGGEKLVPFTPSGRFRFINGYGPCETMAYICSFDVVNNSSVQPIGKPSINTKLYVVDKFMRIVPIGAAGELCISGRQAGRGYLGLKEKTDSVFVKNPFETSPVYSRMYKTGDIVRLLPDGNLEFIGRRDGQVKIRGFRVELTEIEEVIRRFNGVKDATVVALNDAGGGKYVAAYVVGKEKIDIDGLNQFILSEKPPYMVPSVTMQIDAIPYNQNQKVNKRALPEPKREQAVKEPPTNDIERKVFDIAAKILGHEDFGITNGFYDIGMNSISTLKFNVELGKAFNVPVRITDIKKNGNVKLLAAFLGGVEETETVENVSDYPAMQNQIGVYLDGSMNGDSLRYNIPVLFKISDSLDIEKLKAAIVSAVGAHPYMNASFSADADGNIRVTRNDGKTPEIEIINTDRLPAKDELMHHFDVLGDTLYHIAIYKTGEGNYLYIDVHHIIADGTSLGIFINDINTAYCGGELAKERFTEYEFALEEEKLMASKQYDDAKAYYEQLLGGCNTECLPAKCPEEEGKPGCSYANFEFGCSAGISEYCKEHKITENAFFNAVFSYTLSEFLHADDITYCTVYNGRNDSRIAESFGMLVKTLPVRVFVNTETAVSDFVSDMQKQLVDSMSNDIMPFSELSSKYGIKSDIFFNYQGDNFIFDTIGDQKAENIEVELDEGKAPLTIELFLENGTFRAKATYENSCFCEEFVSSFITAMITAAEGFTGREHLKEVPLMSASEKKHFDEMNSRTVPFEKEPAQWMFEKAAEANPDGIAVKTRDASLTFKELDEKANAVANALLELGVNGNEIIGLILNRSELVPVAEIGILKAGCAFLPMLPTYPDDRLDYCLTDAECNFVISTEDIIESKPELFSKDKKCKAVSLESLMKCEKTGKPDIVISQSALAYCIYTSGSTGTPKGVMIEHHNLSNYVQTTDLNTIINSGTTVLCIASISFDLSLSEIYSSLCCGRTIYIASEEEIHNLDMLLDAFKTNAIDVLMMTPSFAWSLVTLPEFEAALRGVSGMMLCAEALPPALFSKLKSLNPDLIVLNGYGPSECTQGSSFKVVKDPKNVTIGGPAANAKYYIMDANGNLLPRYAVGELMICGECVGRGYIHLPEKNKAAFIEIDGVRAYHSGDLVRINRENEGEFGGRADNQVKLRGFRVELDEVESVMQEFEGVTQSKVIVRNNGTEDYLAGFFTASHEISIEALTEYMKTKLTYYMVPAAMMQLEKMPMTPNGKLDKKALPEITPAKKERVKRAPKKSLEERITDIIREVLKIDECYIDDNFFEIGGTSLSASKVVMQLKSMGYKIEYQDIFDHQTAEELAEYLESLGMTVSAKEEKKDSSAFFTMDPDIEELLKCNTLEYANKVVREPLGDVVLTGAVGFLGAHIFRTLVETEKGKIICIMRRGQFEDLETRLKSILVYYFEDDFSEALKNRLMLIEGDITDDNLCDLFKNISFDTLINCAASVKHYANDNSIEFVNVHGVENLIKLTKEKNARMIQISTTSVPGAHSPETYKANLRMTENQLFVIDDMNNQYGQSKYHAELKMFAAMKEGMKGKVIRVGNLMGRYSDGEFQTNMRSNAFLNALRGFANMHECPISHSTDPMSFSPIDCTAQAVVLLAGTNDMFTAFHADSRQSFDEMKVVDACNRCGITVTPVADEKYYDDFYRMMGDQKMNEKISALLTNDRPDMHMVDTDNRFTANVLYRLGFSWPFIDDGYLDRVIKSLDALDFFFLE